MKKIFICLLLTFFTTFAFSQNNGSVELDVAISSSVREIKSILPTTSVVAIYGFESPTAELSKYITNSLIQNLSNTSLRVVERDSQNGEYEIEYSTSNVSNNSIYQVAKKLGAQYVVYGSFEQYGTLLQLTVRVTNVETGEIPVVSFYFVQKNKKLETLLGSSLVLESSSDYIEAIASCMSKIENINAEYNSEVNNVKTKISSEYQVQINEVKTREKAPWLNQIEHEANIENEVNKIESERDTKISGEIESISIKYDELRTNVENEIENLKRKLEIETFVLRDEDVNLLVGEFNTGDKGEPKHWKYSIESRNENIVYKYEGMYIPLATDIETEWNTIENTRTTTGFTGEIVYQVLPNKNNSFDVKILNVKVLYPNGKVLKTENINETIAQISATNKNIVSEKSNTNQTDVKAQTSTAVKTTYTNTKSSNQEETNAKKQPRVNDIVGIGFYNLNFDRLGISVNAFSSSWDNVFVNWLNFIYTSGEYYEEGETELLEGILFGIDCGYTTQLWKFYPFIKGGLYYGMINDPYYDYDSDYIKDDWAEGLFIKLGVGTDFKLNNYFKLFTNIDAYMCMSGDFFFGFNLGLAVGKPAKK